MKKAQGAPDGNANAQKQSGQNDHIVFKTSESLATQHGVSEKTVRRYGEQVQVALTE